jgi:hypothetical protein
MGSHLAHIEALVRPFASAGCVAIVQDDRALLAELGRLLGAEAERHRRAAVATEILEQLGCCAPRYAESIAGPPIDP